jgi:hypothetical protein
LYRCLVTLLVDVTQNGTTLFRIVRGRAQTIYP